MIPIIISQYNIHEEPPLHQVPPHKVLIAEEVTIQPPSQADQRIALQRSTRIRRFAIPSNYVKHLIDMDEKDDDPKMFLQAMNGENFLQWLDAMKEELSSMDKNYM